MAVSLSNSRHFHNIHIERRHVWLALIFAVLIIACGLGQWLIFRTLLALPPISDAALGVVAMGLSVMFVLPMTVAFIYGRRRDRLALAQSFQNSLDHMQRRMNAQEEFLHLIANNEDAALYIFDKNNKYWFINAFVEKSLDRTSRDLIGQAPSKILAYDRASRLMRRLKEVREKQEDLDTLDQITDQNGETRYIQSVYKPLSAYGSFPGGIMLREQDVTRLLVERERRETMLRQVIATLVAVVDRRDPFATGHSARVGQLARALAEEIILSEKEIEAVEIAGSLMNFGKMLVPRAILTKASALTQEELEQVRQSILTSADILSIIDFSVPVVPTLRQALEHFDGTGIPKGLKGDQILITARILSVANAYVAQVSPRAYRASLTHAQACENLLDGSGKMYDPNIVRVFMEMTRRGMDKIDWLHALIKSTSSKQV